jgi:hypothetical protein
MLKNTCFCFVSSGYAPDTAKVNIITMAVNTLASGEYPRAPALEMKLFFLFHNRFVLKNE